MAKLTQKDVKKLFHYNPDAGILFWKTPKSTKIKPGDFVGCLNPDGYLVVVINGKLYLQHRIIWLYVHGYFPENDIDHINRYRNDNRLCNLREVSRQCNARNSKLRKNNTSGITGISYVKSIDKWTAHVKIAKKYRYLGSFKDYHEAVCHRLAAEQCLGWDGCDSNSSAYQFVKKHIQK